MDNLFVWIVRPPISAFLLPDFLTSLHSGSLNFKREL